MHTPRHHTQYVFLYMERKSEKMFCIFFRFMRPWFVSPIEPQFLKNVDCFPNTIQDCGLHGENKWQPIPPLSTWASLAASISSPPTAPSVPLNPHSPVLRVVSIAANFSGPLSLCSRTHWQQHGCSLKHSLFRAFIILHAPALSPFAWAGTSLLSGFCYRSFSQSLPFPSWWFYSHLCCQ